MKRVTVVSLAAVLIASTVFFVGCSKKQNTGNGNAADIVLYAGTQSDYPPFAFIDDANQITGFDPEVMRLIGDRIPGYKVEIRILEWDNMFLALDSRRLNLIGDSIAITEERAKKYYFSDPYNRDVSVILVKGGRKDIKGLADLEGKHVCAFVGQSYTTLLEDYNAEHGNKIILDYVDGVQEADIILSVQNGRYDAYITSPIMAAENIKKHNLNVDIVEEPVGFEPFGFVFNKDEEGKKIRDLFNAAIKELKADGSLSALSIKWTGGDYIPD
ncbi:amino acid ABC transporter substrate-binding protein [Spirochaetia bacterium]|nr:amino acid ABC transporter substrate-binding protein [Spirochaetia bacterium]